MKKRIIAIIALLALALVTFSACAKQDHSFSDTSYIYEKLAGDGTFVININDDKTFSYIGDIDGNYTTGSWDYNDGILTLTENAEDGAEVVNRFRVIENYIAFIAEGSNNFVWPTAIEDGDRFFDIKSK